MVYSSQIMPIGAPRTVRGAPGFISYCWSFCLFDVGTVLFPSCKIAKIPKKLLSALPSQPLDIIRFTMIALAQSIPSKHNVKYFK